MIKFEKINKEQFKKDCNYGKYSDISIPQRSTIGSAGYDIRSPIDINLHPNKTYLIPTGIKCFMDKNIVLQLYIRSSMAIKHNLILLNSVGIVDSDFASNEDNDGHIHICIKNNGNEIYKINIGDKIAQGVFTKYLMTDDDNAHGIRNGGVGSTGK